MKKGNIGVVLDILGKKIKDSLGKRADQGLTGKDGVLHPSLKVNLLILNPSVITRVDLYMHGFDSRCNLTIIKIVD